MTASISGKVKNNEGDFLPGVIIRAVHEPTGSTFAQIVDDSGTYLFDRIKVGGPYQISAAHSGFEEQIRKGVHVRTEETHVEDFDLLKSTSS